jgi:B12-binding domain/radical SAM domain protein
MAMAVDVALLHAPAVLDFRERPRIWGPLADVVPSTALFDMYPVGETSLLDALDRAGFDTLLVNLASHLVADPTYDLDARLRALDAAIVGIDLHWLPHAQGALAVARRVKELHPNTWVVLGGLSASYFHREILARYPWIDAVLRGDSTEGPMVALARAVITGRGEGLDAVPNLAYRHRAPGADIADPGEIHVNPLSHVPTTLDGIRVPAYDAVVRAALRQRSIADVEPYHGWRSYPTTMLLSLRGCTMSCIVCGGSRDAYREICGRERPALRSAADLADDLERIGRLSRHPVFVVGDLRLGGRERWQQLIARWRRRPPANELVLELFGPAPDAFFRDLEASGVRFSIELSVESQDRAVRAVQRKFACADAAIEATIRAALAHGAGKVDVFFMTGLSGQDAASARGIVDYARSLADRLGGDRRVEPFVAPLGPFVDPGSAIWRDPDRYGYRLRYRSLEDHRAALSARTWRSLLGYETRWMDRAAIVDATYDVALGLADLKASVGILSSAQLARLRAHAADERAWIDALEAPATAPVRARGDAPGVLVGGSLCDPAELTWPARAGSER